MLVKLRAVLERKSVLIVLGLLSAYLTLPNATFGQSGTPVVTPSDLSYLGLFRVPTQVGNASPGLLAARRVGSDLRFFMIGTPGNNFLYEFNNSGYASTLAAAPRATLLRSWGDPYQNRRLDVRGVASSAMQTSAIYWSSGLLYWLYHDVYNVAQNLDPSIGVTALNDATGTMTASGPWKTDLPPHMTHNYLVETPAAFAAAYLNGRPLAIGSIGISSGAVSSPWGSNLFSLRTPPTPSLPTSTVLPTGSLVAFDVNHRQPRDGNYVNHGYPDINPSVPSTAFGQGVGSWTQIDTNSTGAAVWIDLPDRSAFITIGYLGQGHIWYGNGNNCGHGIADGWGIRETTGPHAQEYVPVLWIWDPNDLARVAQGQVAGYTIRPTAIVDLRIYSALIRSQVLKINGAYFDRTTGLLYVSSAETEQAGIEWLPVVHVFRVGAGGGPGAPASPTNVRIIRGN